MAKYYAYKYRGGKSEATTGEWAQEIEISMESIVGQPRIKGISNKTDGLDELRSAVDAVSDKLGERLKL